jgi:acyl-CoA thioester hydrolase
MSDPQSTSRKPLQIHTDTVRPDWIDYNQHMNDGYYVVAFTKATDAVQDLVGLDTSYRASTGCSIYTVEAHLQYLREVPVNASLRFDSYVLGVDAKRLHLLHAMYNADQNYLAASHELMLLNVDQQLGKTTPFPDPMRQQLWALHESHRDLPTPVDTGRRIQPVTR